MFDRHADRGFDGSTMEDKLAEISQHLIDFLAAH
jgi:hypothetical protein